MLFYKWRRYTNLDRFNRSDISTVKGEIIRELNDNGFFRYSYNFGCTDINLDLFDCKEMKFTIRALLHNNISDHFYLISKRDWKITTLHINEHLHYQKRSRLPFSDDRYRDYIFTKYSPIPLGKVRIFNFKGTELVQRPAGWRRFKFQRF